MSERFIEALGSLPSPGGNGYHPRLLGVANIGVRAGLKPRDVAEAIRRATPSGSRRVTDREIMEAVNKATQSSGRPIEMGRWRGASQPQQLFNPASVMAKLQRDAAGIGEADIWEASPIRVNWPPEHDAVAILETLYESADILFVGERHETTVRPVSAWLEDFKAGGPIPPHVVPNTMTGQRGLTKDGRPSFRADACVSGFRFAVAEFDSITREDQLRFWWDVNLPVCALIDSGGKSLHAWIRIDGVTNQAQWDAEVEAMLFADYLVPLGCDSACRNESRLSRMPGHYRSEKKRWQRVLFLCREGRRIGQ